MDIAGKFVTCHTLTHQVAGVLLLAFLPCAGRVPRWTMSVWTYHLSRAQPPSFFSSQHSSLHQQVLQQPGLIPHKISAGQVAQRPLLSVPCSQSQPPGVHLQGQAPMAMPAPAIAAQGGPQAPGTLPNQTQPISPTTCRQERLRQPGAAPQGTSAGCAALNRPPGLHRLSSRPLSPQMTISTRTCQAKRQRRHRFPTKLLLQLHLSRYQLSGGLLFLATEIGLPRARIS